MRLVFKDGKSNKFWEAVVRGTSLDTTWGRIGTRGQAKREKFSSGALARAACDKLVAEKKKKGYREDGAVAPVKGARDEKLEAAIRANRDDVAARLVYSDFLQSAGDPLGELIAVQVALEKKKNAAQVKREQALIKQLDLLDADLGQLGFSRGLLDSVRLENTRDWMDDSFDVRPSLEKLFSSAACCALRELKVGVIRWDRQHEDVQTIFEVASRFPWAAHLEQLHLGDVHDVDMAHHSIGIVGAPISKTFPALRSLIMHSGQHYDDSADSFVFSGLALPELKALVIETCSMSKKRLKALWAAKLPKLEALTVWFGSEDQGADATLKDLTPLLEGKVFPNLKHLGLANAAFESELAAALPKSKLAPQLESLDLSMGTLHDGDVPGLVAAAKVFKKLRSLDVTDNFLTKAGVAALAKAYPNLEGSDQRSGYEVDGERYVSVSE